MSQAFAAVKAGEESLLCRSYSRYPLAIVRGKGARLWDVDGKEYVDLLAGIAVTALGHCNDEICAALEAQARKLWHVSNLFYQEEQLELARLLLSTSHHGKAFFCNSGAEANEACIKLARRYMAAVHDLRQHNAAAQRFGPFRAQQRPAEVQHRRSSYRKTRRHHLGRYHGGNGVGAVVRAVGEVEHQGHQHYKRQQHGDIKHFSAPLLRWFPPGH